MSGLTKITLEKPGEKRLFAPVRSVKLVKGNFGDDYAISDDTVVVYVKKTVADGRAERMNCDSPLAWVGANIVIGRSTTVGKNGHPFWDVDYANAYDRQASKPSKRIQVPPPEKVADAFADAPLPPEPEWVAGGHQTPADPEPDATTRERIESIAEQKRADIRGAYIRELHYVIDTVLPICKRAAIGLDLNAAVATLLIQQDKKGCL